MSLVQINWQPNRKTLKEFSELWLFFFGMVLAPMAYFGAGPFRAVGSGNFRLAAILWCLAVVGRLVGWLRVEWMKPVFIGMTLIALPIGMAVSFLAMALIYFCVFTPVAVLFRLIGRDALHRTLDRQAKTYWEAYNPDRGMARYLRQF